MTDSMPGQHTAIKGAIERAKAILLKPAQEWSVIDAEPSSIGGIYSGYVLILAAIGPVCGLIGSMVFGYSMFGVTYRPGFGSALSSAVVQYALSLAMVYVLALIIDALAPTFNGTKNQLQAFKVAAYASTASWVGGVFGLIPSLAVLGGLAGLYSLYLLYLGLPKLMKVAQDKAIAYIALVVVASIVLFLVIGAITGAVTGLVAGIGGAALTSSTATTTETTTGTLNVPGMGSVDLDKLQAATKQMEAAANQAAAPAGSQGAITAVPSATLQSFLPPALPGLPRTGLESSSGGAGGIQGSTAEATYGSGDARIKLSVTDMGAAGAFAALGSAFNVNSSKEDADGYEKIGQVDGRMTTEKWRNDGKNAEYSVIVGNRFMVSGDGNGVEMDAVKAAVASISPGTLEGLAK